MSHYVHKRSTDTRDHISSICVNLHRMGFGCFEEKHGTKMITVGGICFLALEVQSVPISLKFCVCLCWTAEVYIGMSKPAEATACTQEAANLFPTSHNVLYMRGQIAELRGNMDEAKRWYEEALSINPTHVKTMQRLVRHSVLHLPACSALTPCVFLCNYLQSAGTVKPHLRRASLFFVFSLLRLPLSLIHSCWQARNEQTCWWRE